MSSIGFVLNWFGVCAVSAVNGFGCYIVLTKYEDYKENITQPVAPTVVVVLMSFLIVRSFLSIFSYSMDAIMQSFLLDESMSDYSNNARPDHMQKFFDGLQKHAKPSRKDLERKEMGASAQNAKPEPVNSANQMA